MYSVKVLKKKYHHERSIRISTCTVHTCATGEDQSLRLVISVSWRCTCYLGRLQPPFAC